ncbi:LysR family transcriptional regulator [Psychromonas sp. PT13]|uniref:LysR family transcriptional regulator n=1 Tax=Psychromonas sp. PT13 TaxID=3439547 RepID=UPI003EBDCD27
MNLKQIDLNLLSILKQLLTEKHVTNTALTLDISQPTVSRSLNKLRKLFNDSLLVRSHTSYELTPKAIFIKQELNQLFAHLDKLLEGESFNPSISHKTVKLFGLLPHMELISGELIQRICQQAPNMIVDIDTISKPHFTALIAGDVHFVISALPPPSSEQELYRMSLYKQDFCLLMRKKHPLTNQEITPKNLKACKFGQISLQGDKRLTIEAKFEKIGYKDKILSPVRLNNFASVASITEATDIVFHLPTSYGKMLCNNKNIITRDLPTELTNDKFDNISLYWHKRHHNDPMCLWIRSLVKDIVSNSKNNNILLQM